MSFRKNGRSMARYTCKETQEELLNNSDVNVDLWGTAVIDDGQTGNLSADRSCGKWAKEHDSHNIQ